MVGLPELIVIAVIALFVIGPLVAVFYCRKHYPSRLGIGILLCIFNGGFAQFYFPGGMSFFLILFVLYFLLMNWAELGFFAVNLIACGIMYWRYQKLPKNDQEKQQPYSN
jgi:membrane protein implicated in regulation of membrane protease activity